MITRRTLIKVVLVALPISIILPAIVWYKHFFTSLHDKIDSSKLADLATFQSLIISFWGLLLNIVLVILAYRAFKNFGVKEQFHNKQLTLVTELATEISSTVLSNMMYETKTDPNGKDHLIATGYTLSFFEISMAFDYTKFDLMCVMTNNIENTFPFLKYRKNPVLPRSIARQLDKLYRPLQSSFTIQKESLPKSYVMLHSKNKPDKEDYSKSWIYPFYKKPTDFSRDSKALRMSIIEWFKEYGADDVNI